jgi:hypothetical protein
MGRSHPGMPCSSLPPRQLIWHWPLRRGDQACLDRFKALFAQPDLLVVELSASVVERGLRTPDAVMITGGHGQ